jgi:phosphoribosylglycinamide formyltransferase-1
MRVAVLASGRGSNLLALLEQVHGREAEIVAVAGDRPDAPAFAHARAHGVPVRGFPLADHDGDRAARDAAIADWLGYHGVHLVVLAGYMALLDPGFVARYPDRIVNVHPSLLPAFPGLHAVEQAVTYGVKVAGVTVHFVDEGIDTGAIIAQRATTAPDPSDPATLHAALQDLEHELLPEVVRWFARGAVRRDPADPRRVLIGA